MDTLELLVARANKHNDAMCAVHCNPNISDGLWTWQIKSQVSSQQFGATTAFEQAIVDLGAEMFDSEEPWVRYRS